MRVFEIGDLKVGVICDWVNPAIYYLTAPMGQIEIRQEDLDLLLPALRVVSKQYKKALSKRGR